MGRLSKSLEDLPAFRTAGELLLTDRSKVKGKGGVWSILNELIAGCPLRTVH